MARNDNLIEKLWLVTCIWSSGLKFTKKLYELQLPLSFTHFYSNNLYISLQRIKIFFNIYLWFFYFFWIKKYFELRNVCKIFWDKNNSKFTHINILFLRVVVPKEEIFLKYFLIQLYINYIFSQQNWVLFSFFNQNIWTPFIVLKFFLVWSSRTLFIIVRRFYLLLWILIFNLISLIILLILLVISYYYPYLIIFLAKLLELWLYDPFKFVYVISFSIEYLYSIITDIINNFWITDRTQNL